MGRKETEAVQRPKIGAPAVSEVGVPSRNPSATARKQASDFTVGGVRNGGLAEREGFEPPVRFPVLRISSATHSTTLPPLREGIAPDGPMVAAAISRCGPAYQGLWEHSRQFIFGEAKANLRARLGMWALWVMSGDRAAAFRRLVHDCCGRRSASTQATLTLAAACL